MKTARLLATLTGVLLGAILAFSPQLWSYVRNEGNNGIFGGSINGTPIGATTASTGAFTTLTASGLTTPTAGITVTGGAVTLSPASFNDVLSPTGTGVVTINPATAGTIDNEVLGGTTPLAGTFTVLKGTTSVGSTSLLDGNGNAFVTSSATASAVDSITVTNAATANPATVTIASSGTDNNVNLTLNAKGTGLVQSTSFANFTGNRVFMTADWSCGTGGTVSSCTSAVIIGSGGGTALTLTLPLQAASYHWHCEGVVGQATAATANNWNVITSSNAPTNLETSFMMSTAATTIAGGGTTGASSTSTANIGGAWTLGGTGSKMPFQIDGTIEGASASGTVISLQLVAPTVADLVTIYRGAYCSVGAF